MCSSNGRHIWHDQCNHSHT